MGKYNQALNRKIYYHFSQFLSSMFSFTVFSRISHDILKISALHISSYQSLVFRNLYIYIYMCVYCSMRIRALIIIWILHLRLWILSADGRIDSARSVEHHRRSVTCLTDRTFSKRLNFLIRNFATFSSKVKKIIPLFIILNDEFSLYSLRMALIG